jgi:phosphoglycolate phosphatase
VPPPIVVFDLDNTLVHSRIDFLGIRRAIIERLLEAGALAEPPAPRSRSIPEWMELAEAVDPSLAAELWQVVDRFEREGMLHGTIEEDARATLDALRAAGARLAVLTNNSLDSALAALERFDLRAPVELVLARSLVDALKPSGVGVALAHARLGGGVVYVVGDSYIDGLAAQRAGLEPAARFIAFRSDVADLRARGVEPWARVDLLATVVPLVLNAPSQAPPPPTADVPD